MYNYFSEYWAACFMAGSVYLGGIMGDYEITFSVKARALLDSVEEFIRKPWSLERFRKMKADAERLRKWAPKTLRG